MKYFAVISTLLCVLVMSSFGQTTVPKQTVSGKAQTATKNSATASKPKPKPTQAKPGSAGKTTATKPAASPSDEKTEYDAAAAMADTGKRIQALKKFLSKHGRSDLAATATELLVRSEAEAGGKSLEAGDLKTAAISFTAAVTDAPKPLPEKLFTDVIAKFPPALYWRGDRAAAFEVATLIEAKCDTNAAQMLAIAAFYMNIENGAEAKRIANAVIAREPSSPAYQTLGLANRIDFQLEDSAAAYARALEIEPDSVTARRGLAEMKRALGKPDEAAELYRQIIAADAANIPAQTGLILSLFDAGKRTDAETAMAASLEQNAGNVMLLAGAAYWYAAHKEGKKAIELAQKAIAADPRFIWSHIALARGLMAEKQPMDAEKTLLSARQYGNFPTLEYEIASAKAAAGFYREAAEELSKSFSVKDGVISAKLGGRVTRESADFTELISFERRASISTPGAADTPENATELRSLLDLWTKMGTKDVDPDALAKSADDFTRGDDNMRLHRLLFAATGLLERKKALPKVLELSHAAIGAVDNSLNVASPSSSVLADEVYDNRRLAVTRDEYIKVPDVPRQTLMNIVRGRVEDLTGRVLFETDNNKEAVVRLKRAISVLPAGSAWWRTSAWRLGTALAADGKGAEALDIYIKCYKSAEPDVIKYSVIASLYQRLNGSLDGLETKIGRNPAPATETVAKVTEPTPTPDVPKVVPATTPTPEIAKVEPTPTPSIVRVEPTPTPEVTKVESTSTPEVAKVEPTPTPEAVKIEPTATPTPENLIAEPKSEPTPAESIVAKVDEQEPKKAVETPVEEKKPAETDGATTGSKELFPPVIITIPPPGGAAKKTDADKARPETTTPAEEKAAVVDAPKAETKSLEKPVDERGAAPDERSRIAEERPAETSTACSITLSEASLTLQNSGGDLAVIVGTEDDRDIPTIKAESSDPKDINVRREPIVGIKGRALFVVSSISPRAGSYSVKFILPCGQRELLVRVR